MVYSITLHVVLLLVEYFVYDIREYSLIYFLQAADASRLCGCYITSTCSRSGGLLVDESRFST